MTEPTSPLRRSDGYVLPERIGRLGELAFNLWWTWHFASRALFKSLDRGLWKSTTHNAVRVLHDIHADRLKAASEDPTFLQKYDAAVRDFDAYMDAQSSWCSRRHPGLSRCSIAYFSMEYALHTSLPLYAGGLGVLAGDYLKEASDIGLPVVAVGFMYPQGYFQQRIAPDGRQEELYMQLEFDKSPVSPVVGRDGKRLKIVVDLGEGTKVWLNVWRANIGKVRLYLLDTTTDENPPKIDQLSARLYWGDAETRLRQEILLGVGGVRVLRALGIEPEVWHLNEGHAAFATLERVREHVQKGRSFAEAAQRVRETTVFTTHTPVPAGNDVFPCNLVDRYFTSYWPQMGTDRQTFLSLGSCEGAQGDGFQLTALALRMADCRNAVSQLHGRVARKMWHRLWPQVKEDEVPIASITNGVHVPTWVAPQTDALYRKYLGKAYIARHDEPELLKGMADIPDEEVWRVHQWLKRKLISLITDRARQAWADEDIGAEQALAMGSLLDSEVLTIAFARRFTDYKRPGLIFRDPARLMRILRDPWRPVQIIFAGKSHPADLRGEDLIQQVCSLVKDRRFGGRLAFVEDYDMHVARYFVQGVDVWLNNPRPLQEASGTSGMKAAINGILNLSVPDGWWAEGYNGRNGWAIGDGSVAPDNQAQDARDASALYDLLENKIVPAYYDRDRDGIPHEWVKTMKESVRSVMPFFCTCRMAKQYTEELYVKAARAAGASKPPSGPKH